ncbi:MAG: N-acetylglucosamine-6-phosphate deacetylase [Spirochaetota bacterium]|nr:N-acetylglucosamine-6-phosphate deacetylase [Spirochaetota bacterium]
MRLIITEEHVGDWAAYFIAKRILDFNPTEQNPFILGIPGGGTVLPMYERLVQFHRDGVLSFKNIVFFNTGEYLGISPSNVNSFYSTINTRFFNFVDAELKNIHLLNSLAEDIKEEGQRYEELIKSYGGVHLWICGLGDDGHLAFNEPGSSLTSRTRDKELTFETRVANAKFFNGKVELVPKIALTIGVGTLLDAQEIVVLAQGSAKARALQVSIEEGINHLYPASALQMHTKATFVASEEAVVDIRVRTYRYHKEVEAKNIHPKILIKGLYKSYYALVNARVFDGDKFLDNATVIIENDRIKSIEMDSSLDIVMTKIDLKGKIIVPGYIDLQVNGCGGADINHDISLDTLQVLHETNIKHGVTSIAPTLITTSDERILEAIDLINHLENPELLGIIAWHFEGPYLSKIKKGIHEEKYIRKPSIAILDAIINTNISRKIVTLAPEEVDSVHIKKLADAGVIVSMGHTNGTFAQISEKIPSGLTMATHLYNAMKPFDSREPGAVGTVLESDNIYAGIIVDGIHCNYASVDIAYKSLGDHLFLVSDSSAPAGTDIKEFEFGGRKIYHRDGRCIAEDGTLAGVAILMDKCVQNLVKYVKVPLEDAFRMASLYPARSINKDDEYGYLKPGYKADITILDTDLKVHGVVSNGRYIPVEN